MPPHEAFHLADAIGGPVKLTFADGTTRYALLKSASTDRARDEDPWDGGARAYSTRTSYITTTLEMVLIRDTEPARARGFRAFLRRFFRVGAQ